MLFDKTYDWLEALAGPAIGAVAGAVAILGLGLVFKYFDRRLDRSSLDTEKKNHAEDIARDARKIATLEGAERALGRRIEGLEEDVRGRDEEIEKHVQKIKQLEKRLHECESPGDLDDLEAATMGMMRDEPRITKFEIGEALKISQVVVDDRLHRLSQRGFIVIRNLITGPGCELLQPGREWLRRNKINP